MADDIPQYEFSADEAREMRSQISLELACLIKARSQPGGSHLAQLASRCLLVSPHAPHKLNITATFANIASPSKSGNFDIDNPATMAFIHFYFENIARAAKSRTTLAWM